MSAAEQQAVESAKGYLALGQGFSRAGLIQQLTSSSSEGFTTANAEFAISYLNPDWDAQAVESEKSYLALGQGFSRAGLLRQLTSSSGAGFTEAQAEYAVSDLNPDWDAQAVESAKGYLALGQGFSRAGLIQQLTSSSGEGFTEAQAEYAASKVGPVTCISPVPARPQSPHHRRHAGDRAPQPRASTASPLRGDIAALTTPGILCRFLVRSGLSLYHGHHGMADLARYTGKPDIKKPRNKP